MAILWVIQQLEHSNEKPLWAFCQPSKEKIQHKCNIIIEIPKIHTLSKLKTLHFTFCLETHRRASWTTQDTQGVAGTQLVQFMCAVQWAPCATLTHTDCWSRSITEVSYFCGCHLRSKRSFCAFPDKKGSVVFSVCSNVNFRCFNNYVAFMLNFSLLGWQVTHNGFSFEYSSCWMTHGIAMRSQNISYSRPPHQNLPKTETVFSGFAED